MPGAMREQSSDQIPSLCLETVCKYLWARNIMNINAGPRTTDNRPVHTWLPSSQLIWAEVWVWRLQRYMFNVTLFPWFLSHISHDLRQRSLGTSGIENYLSSGDWKWLIFIKWLDKWNRPIISLALSVWNSFKYSFDLCWKETMDRQTLTSCKMRA